MEIERKWLISGFPEGLPELERAHAEQSYLCTAPVVRVRKKWNASGCSYVLCFKGKGTLAREEIELMLDAGTYERIRALAGADPIRKDYRVYALEGGLRLECSRVDEGAPEEFYYAEVEFPTVEEALAFAPPAFLGREVTEESGWGMAAYWARTRAARGD